ncbi:MULTISPECIES: hypothetical protein [Stenotrophomonas]|jgi:hypothetical protein|uniref:hypothetical protein n=1 Tax=Stenotrophomonas TaxID=40323 RepID=UPI00201CDA90|nr:MULTISPECIES: hypothetical protein [Stenotrophomonas]MBN5025849.1 hypothetical protein [Stenotrophomonas maltophilia]MDH1274936.1 hypothetical protein [Stenotrophomonas sp. GD03937]MDH1486678.1 hypothetical protein [Stenotrophomonas sp. GD03712]UQY94510.1 hypothetical protein LZ605_15385 [Stenotrophomonas maltophilia]WON68791.1 hypothetical protein RWT08_00085 [Stenotrophomonas maltophilia]
MIVLPGVLRAGQTLAIGDDGVRAFFSQGVNAFAGKSGCYSTADSGQIIIDAVKPNRFEVSLEATFRLASPLDWPEDFDVPASIHRAIKAKSADIAELRAWEGRPGGGDDSPLKRRILQQNAWNQDDNSAAAAGGVLYRRCPR